MERVVGSPDDEGVGNVGFLDSTSQRRDESLNVPRQVGDCDMLGAGEEGVSSTLTYHL